MADPYDAVVIGGGILGLATARRLLLERPGWRVLVLEKEQRLAMHQTGRTSGVIHSGVYYTPGSLKARLCSEGKRELERYADERGVQRIERGKLIVALDASELERLAELERRGRANGVPGLRVLEGAELREIEPNVQGVRALHAPHTGVIDFAAVANAFAEDIAQAGGEVALGRAVTGITERAQLVEVDTSGGPVEARLVVSCAGLQSDRLARRAEVRIVPFRGDYYTLSPAAASLVNGLVYPVPDPAFPFLGVHFTKQVDGTVVAGPNAVLALARERYGRLGFSARDTLATVTYPGFWRFAARHFATGAAEAWRDVSKRAFVRDLQRYVPRVGAADVTFGPTGIRGQALGPGGRLADDFVLGGSGRVIHVVNAPSPAATSSLAIARHLAQLALDAVA
ncbi:MAG TPA: L-2-hydroxyglutarate oxidase [Gaiellaceae bacterium]|nr:L-2-hydroxyglutarate oxidase [Gaiellaceae bacterium]